MGQDLESANTQRKHALYNVHFNSSDSSAFSKSPKDPFPLKRLPRHAQKISTNENPICAHTRIWKPNAIWPELWRRVWSFDNPKRCHLCSTFSPKLPTFSQYVPTRLHTKTLPLKSLFRWWITNTKTYQVNDIRHFKISAGKHQAIKSVKNGP